MTFGIAASRAGELRRCVGRITGVGNGLPAMSLDRETRLIETTLLPRDPAPFVGDVESNSEGDCGGGVIWKFPL